ncbi:MAG: AAA family ATPase, partial [Blastocatellia bacterium]
GQWEERVEAVIDQLSEINGTLCVPSLLDLILTGGSDPGSGVAAFLAPYIQNRELTVVAEATPSELEACQRLLPSFTGLFQILAIEPLGKEQSLSVLQRSAENLASAHRLTISTRAADQVYRLFKRFAPYQPMPGPAVAFLTETVDRARAEKLSEVSAATVTVQFIRKTGLPELFLRDEQQLEYQTVVDAFRREVIGQEQPCSVAADLVVTFKAGLNDPARPIGVLLFCGPTGVGKTEMAKSIAQYFFGHGDAPKRLLRLDMSEYSGAGAADRLFIAPDGGPSDFIKRIRQQPFSVVLLDEIEKADAEVFDALLGALDEGRITDRFGRTATLGSAIIIMTSNIGADK